MGPAWALAASLAGCGVAGVDGFVVVGVESALFVGRVAGSADGRAVVGAGTALFVGRVVAEGEEGWVFAGAAGSALFAARGAAGAGDGVVAGWAAGVGAGVESRLGRTKIGACAKIGGAAIGLHRIARRDVTRVTFIRKLEAIGSLRIAFSFLSVLQATLGITIVLFCWFYL